MTARGARVKSDESRELMASLSAKGCVAFSDLRLLLQWTASHQMQSRLLGWLCIAAVQCTLLHFRGLSKQEGNWPFWEPLPPSSTLVVQSHAVAADQLTSLLVPLALGTAIHTISFFRAVLSPFEKLGIYYNTVFKMLASDVTCAPRRASKILRTPLATLATDFDGLRRPSATPRRTRPCRTPRSTSGRAAHRAPPPPLLPAIPSAHPLHRYWLILFLIFLLTYGFVMYVCYPPNFDAASQLTSAEPAHQFVQYGTAFWALFELSLLGERGAPRRCREIVSKRSLRFSEIL